MRALKRLSWNPHSEVTTPYRLPVIARKRRLRRASVTSGSEQSEAFKRPNFICPNYHKDIDAT